MIAIIGDQPIAVAVQAALHLRGDDVISLSEADLAQLSPDSRWTPERLDALFLGIPPAPPRAPVGEIDIADFDQAIEAGLMTRFSVLSQALPLLAANTGRVLIEVGSDAIAGGGRRALDATVSAALLGLARATALEYAEEGVTVNSLLTAPPAVDWPASPRSDAIATLALTLLGPGAGGANGAMVACDGGLTAVVQLPPEIPDAPV